MGPRELPLWALAIIGLCLVSAAEDAPAYDESVAPELLLFQELPTMIASGDARVRRVPIQDTTDIRNEVEPLDLRTPIPAGTEGKGD